MSQTTENTCRLELSEKTKDRLQDMLYLISQDLGTSDRKLILQTIQYFLVKQWNRRESQQQAEEFKRWDIILESNYLSEFKQMQQKRLMESKAIKILDRYQEKKNRQIQINNIQTVNIKFEQPDKQWHSINDEENMLKIILQNITTKIIQRNMPYIYEQPKPKSRVHSVTANKARKSVTSKPSFQKK